MKYEVIESENKKILEVQSMQTPISTENDALELVALCGEHNTDLLMLHSEAISEDFFRLRTGVAGKVIQKLVNYRLRTAAVISDEKTQVGKFTEMVAEANRGRHFRVFESETDAKAWLVKE